MQTYYFAHYRLLVDDALSQHESMQYLAEFRREMPYTHTFTVHMGDAALLDEQYAEAVKHPVRCENRLFTLHDMGDSWAFASVLDEHTLRRNGKHVLVCSRDYSEMTIYLSQEPYYSERLQRWFTPRVPFSWCIRAACEAGMTLRDGMPLHAALVEKDGYGVIFLGPSGMGKSTQAKLWVQYQGADFVIGDRPGLRYIDGTWYGFGMPWDGKDGIKRQKCVPIKALIALQQAKENQIRRLTSQESIIVLLHQVMMPMWDDQAMDKLSPLMGQLAHDIPFYHLRNLPNEAATILTRVAIGKEDDFL